MARSEQRIVNRRKRAKPHAVQHFDYLRLLAKNANKPAHRKALVSIANRGQLRAVCECIENVLAGNIPVSSAQLQKLKRHRNTLRKLADRRLPVHEQKKLLMQRGGILLGPLIPMALSALAPLIGGLFGKK